MVPEPMLSTPAPSWPRGGEWVMQPKWDGFRLLVEIDERARVRMWSRHGVSLTDRLGVLPDCFATAPPGSVFDGELVAVSQRDGRVIPDFAAVTRAVFSADAAAADQLKFVAFDLLRLDGEDLRPRRWYERDEDLQTVLPVNDRLRLITSQPASVEGHRALVGLGFEGTVLKRPGSPYLPGRHRSWLKHKARNQRRATLLSVRQARDGQWQAICEVDGRRVSALANARSVAMVGAPVALVYSRVDADGGLREARLAPPVRR